MRVAGVRKLPRMAGQVHGDMDWAEVSNLSEDSFVGQCKPLTIMCCGKRSAPFP